jgi:hypothetical protein
MSEGTNKDWPNIGQVPIIIPIFSILQQYVLIDYAQGKSHVVILQRVSKRGYPFKFKLTIIYCGNLTALFIEDHLCCISELLQ